MPVCCSRHFKKYKVYNDISTLAIRITDKKLMKKHKILYCDAPKCNHKYSSKSPDSHNMWIVFKLKNIPNRMTNLFIDKTYINVLHLFLNKGSGKFNNIYYQYPVSLTTFLKKY